MAASPATILSLPSSFTYANKRGFCFISSLLASLNSILFTEFMEKPSLFKDTPIVSLTESNIRIFLEYLGFHIISHESILSFTIDLLYTIPRVPHIYGTEYSSVGSYAAFLNSLSIYL